MEQEKKKLNLKIIIPVIVAIVIIAIVGIILSTSKNDNDNIKDKGEIITGNWKTEVIADKDTFYRIVDSFINEWYQERNYKDGNILNDIKVFKSPNKDNSFVWIANVSIYTTENYRNDGTTYYTKSKDSSAELRDVYMYGYCTHVESTTGGLRTYNKNYTYTTVITIYKDYESALDEVLKLYNASNENELTCIVDNTLIADFKQKVISNNNIYNEMENLLRTGKIDEARNLYYKTPNTDLTKGQSEKCLLLYAKYNELKTWDGTSVDITGNTETNNENDYIILVQSGGVVPKKVVYITVDVENKTYETTKIV